MITIGRGSGDVEMRDVASGRSSLTVPSQADAAVDSPDGRMIAASGGDGRLLLVDAATGDVQHEIDGEGAALHPSFTQDGALVAAAWPHDRGGIVRLVRVADGNVVDEISWPGVVALSFASDGATVAVVSASSGAVLDLTSGRQVAVLESGLGAFTDVAWSPDGNQIAISRDTGAAQIHDAESGRLLAVLPAHKARVEAVAWSPDSTLLVTASSDGTAKVWSLVEGGGRELMTLTADDTRNGFADVAFSPDGSRVVTGTLGGTAIVWRVGLDATAEVATLPGAAFGFGDAEFTADGRRLLATSGEGNIAVWDIADWRRERTIGFDASAGLTTLFGLPPHSLSDPIGLAPSPDGRLVAAVSGEQWSGIDPVLTVHDVERGSDEFHLDVGGWVSPTVSWSGDGRLLAVAGGDRQGIAVVVIADRTGRIVSTRSFPGRFVETARFTHDGHVVVAHSPEGPYEPGTGRVEVWDWRGDETISVLDVDAWYAVPHPSEQLVAIGPRDEATDQTVTLWNYETGQPVATLAGHSGTVNDLAFSADGTRLATANGDGSIRLYDARSGEQQIELRGHAGAVANVSFSPDGRRLASYGVEGTVRVWTLDLDELAAIARARVTRALTAAECDRYLRCARR